MTTTESFVIGLIFIVITGVVGYIVGWRAGQKQTTDTFFQSGIIDAETYKKLIK